MPIPPDTCFACFALDGPVVRVRELLPFQIFERFEVHSSSPVQLDDMWRSWLGSLQARKFESSQFFLLFTRPIAQHGSFRREALQVLHYYHYGLLLQGAGYAGESLLVIGRTQGARLAIDSLHTIKPRLYAVHSQTCEQNMEATLICAKRVWTVSVLQ
jgi:hypothetical protein